MDFLLDTNVLARLYVGHDPLHLLVKTSANALLSRGDTLYITPQVIVEARNVLTRPTSVNGMGLPDTIGNALISRMEADYPMLADAPAIFAEWKQLLATIPIHGKQVHDARLAAVMMTYGIANILTFNGRDFARYPGVTAIDPGSV
jgi:predicted nucleic acid-binding protein